MFKYSFHRPAVIIFLSSCYNSYKQSEKLPKSSYNKGNIPSIIRQKGAPPKKGEPVYSIDDIRLRNGKNGSQSWVTYKDGVYNITNFIEEHPGGESFIRNAAGGPVDDFWEYWGIHHYSNEVSEKLESMRIGKFSDYDYSKDEFENNMYTNEGNRNPELKPYVYQPFEAETPSTALSSGKYTDSSLFYVRNHAPVPYVEEGDKHKIVFIDEYGNQKKIATPDDLIKEFGTKEITSVLQCTGNRANESIQKLGPSKISGKPSENVGYGLIGNAKWSGIPLDKLLYNIYPNLAIAKKSEIERKHLVFYGADEYVSSVPLKKILCDNSRKKNCLLATKMNEEPLSLDHGFPVRVLLPGIVGARSVKWLIKVELKNEETNTCWNKYFYRKNGQSCMEIPLNSLITQIKHEKDVYIISGIAYGDGEIIKNVEVSIDKGKSWTVVSSQNNSNRDNLETSIYGWANWEYHLPISKLTDTKDKNNEIWCRAISNKGKQISELGLISNDKKNEGYLYNGWHQVKLMK